MADMLTDSGTGQEADAEMMTEAKWQAVNAIVETMRKGRVSANELKRIVAYLRWWRNRHHEPIGEHLFSYFQVLIAHGDEYSKSAPGYRQVIERVCREELTAYQQDTDGVIQILGWAARLSQK